MLNYWSSFFVAFQLKQTDYDGQYSYSNLVSLYYNTNFNIDVTVYPNPSSIKKINIKFNEPICSDISIQIKDISGKTIIKSQGLIDQTAPFTMSIKDKVNPGVYFMIISCNYFSQTKKIILR